MKCEFNTYPGGSECQNEARERVLPEDCPQAPIGSTVTACADCYRDIVAEIREHYRQELTSPQEAS